MKYYFFYLFAFIPLYKLNCGELLILYIVMRNIDGFIGCILLTLSRRGKLEELDGNEISQYMKFHHIFIIQKENMWSFISALLFEIFGTFALIMFIHDSFERDNYLGTSLGLAFSITLIALSGIRGNISSCLLNLTRSLAPALFQLIADGIGILKNRFGFTLLVPY